MTPDLSGSWHGAYETENARTQSAGPHRFRLMLNRTDNGLHADLELHRATPDPILDRKVIRFTALAQATSDFFALTARDTESTCLITWLLKVEASKLEGQFLFNHLRTNEVSCDEFRFVRDESAS